MEQLRHALPVVTPSDHLSENWPNVYHLDLAALGLVFRLGQRIRHYQLFQRTLLDGLQRIPAQYSVGHNRVDLRCARLCKVLGRKTQCSTCVRHVVHQDRNFVLGVPDQHHPRDRVRLLALLVEQGKVDAQSVRNRRRPDVPYFDQHILRATHSPPTHLLAPPASGDTITTFLTSKCVRI